MSEEKNKIRINYTETFRGRPIDVHSGVDSVYERAKIHLKSFHTNFKKFLNETFILFDNSVGSDHTRTTFSRDIFSIATPSQSTD